MPYKIKKERRLWTVRNTETGLLRGMHTSKELAQKQINLLRGIEHRWKPTGKPKKKGKSR